MVKSCSMFTLTQKRLLIAWELWPLPYSLLWRVKMNMNLSNFDNIPLKNHSACWSETYKYCNTNICKKRKRVQHGIGEAIIHCKIRSNNLPNAVPFNTRALPLMWSMFVTAPDIVTCKMMSPKSLRRTALISCQKRKKTYV